MSIERPRNQKVWTQPKLECAVRLFMDGQDYEQISEVLTEFTPIAIEHKLRMQGFTQEYRKNKTDRIC